MRLDAICRTVPPGPTTRRTLESSVRPRALTTAQAMDIGSVPARRQRRTLSGDEMSHHMCLAIPGQIVEVLDESNRLARVAVAGVQRTVNIGLLDGLDGGAGAGDWVLI